VARAPADIAKMHKITSVLQKDREKPGTDFEADSLTIVWLDKDELFKDVPPPTDNDYHIAKPGQQAFFEVCNEFWWTITYVAKG